MKITNTEAEVLQLLVATSGSEMYGLEMVKASGGLLKRGSIYVILGRLEDKGFVESRKEELDSSVPPTAPRRLYKATGTGRRVYHAYASFQRETSGHGLCGVAA
jgi:DNA-binding PadR family transcriptional regulator